MRDLFKLRLTNRSAREKSRMNKIIDGFFGKENLRIFGPKLWNSLPYVNLQKIQNPSKKQLSIEMENAVFVGLVTVGNNLMFRFNVDT